MKNVYIKTASNDTPNATCNSSSQGATLHALERTGIVTIRAMLLQVTY